MLSVSHSKSRGKGGPFVGKVGRKAVLSWQPFLAYDHQHGDYLMCESAHSALKSSRQMNQEIAGARYKPYCWVEGEWLEMSQ